MKESFKKPCFSCNSIFTCGQESGNCWCYSFPPIIQPESGSSCLCPACLKKTTMTRINAYVATLTPETALSIGLLTISLRLNSLVTGPY